MTWSSVKISRSNKVGYHAHDEPDDSSRRFDKATLWALLSSYWILSHNGLVPACIIPCRTIPFGLGIAVVSAIHDVGPRILPGDHWDFYIMCNLMANATSSSFTLTSRRLTDDEANPLHQGI